MKVSSGNAAVQKTFLISGFVYILQNYTMKSNVALPSPTSSVPLQYDAMFQKWIFMYQFQLHIQKIKLHILHLIQNLHPSIVGFLQHTLSQTQRRKLQIQALVILDSSSLHPQSQSTKPHNWPCEETLKFVPLLHSSCWHPCPGLCNSSRVIIQHLNSCFSLLTILNTPI